MQTTISGSIVDKIKESLSGNKLDICIKARPDIEPNVKIVPNLDVAADSKLIGKAEISGILRKKIKNLR